MCWSKDMARSNAGERLCGVVRAGSTASLVRLLPMIDL